jgi:NAD(P)-dependent dehydrogenase (short-subunit alcohol dehydrogenase family)
VVDSTVERFAGCVALITGSVGGIGREHARLFALHGAKVVVNDVGFRAIEAFGEVDILINNATFTRLLISGTTPKRTGTRRLTSISRVTAP